MTAPSAPIINMGLPLRLDGSGNLASNTFDPFQNPATWQKALAGLSVVTLSGPVIQKATDAQLWNVFAFLRAHNIALNITNGVIATTPGSSVGLGVEGYADPNVVSAMMQRIKALGGTVAQLTMDSPLVTGHELQGGNAEQASIATLAQQVATTINAVRAVFPSVEIMDAESPNVGADLAPWLAAFKAATGVAISEVNADIDSSKANWLSQIETMSATARAAGAQFGVIADAPLSVQGSQAWVLSAEAQMAAAIADPNVAAAEVKVATWRYFPTQFGPEGSPDTFAHIAAETAAVTPLYAAGTISGNAGVTVAIAPSANAGAIRAVQAVAGQPVGQIGLTLSAPGGNAAATFALVLTAAGGTLAATQAGGGGVAGSGSDVLTLTGTLSGLNAELATLSYAGTAAGTDIIDATLYGASGLIANADIPVAISAPLPLPGPAAAAAQAQATVTALLADLTDAAPAAATVTQWATSLIGGQTLAGVRAGIAGSGAVTAALQSALTVLHGQAPSASQVSALQSQIVGGQTLDQALAPLVSGSALQSQISQAYTQIVGAAPDANTLATLTRSALLGQSLTAIRTTIAQSNAVSGTLTNLFGEVYGAAPTAAQLAAMQTAIVGGSSLAAQVAQLDGVAANEVTALYQQVLDRAPGAQDQQHWTTQLESGMRLSTVRGQVALSPEARGLVATAYHAATGLTASGTMLTELQETVTSGVALDQVSHDLGTIEARFIATDGTAPQESDIAPLVNLYKAGWTDAQVAQAIASAPAPKAALTTAYQNDFHHVPLPATTNALIAQLAGSTLSATLASIAAAAAADRPVMGGLAPTEGVPENDQAYPLRSVTLADADPTQMETAVVKLSAPVGTLSAGGGTISPNGLTYTTVTASASLVDSLLQNLVFRPNASVPANTSATLSVSVTNSIGNTTTLTTAITDQAVTGPAKMAFMFLSPASETVAASPLSDIIVEGGPSFGQDVITGFDPAHDILQLPKSDFPDVAHALAHVTAAPGGGAMIAYDPHDTVTLPGVLPSALNTNNIQVV